MGLIFALFYAMITMTVLLVRYTFKFTYLFVSALLRAIR